MWKATISADQTLEHALPYVIGKDAPQVRLGPGDVDEQGDEGPIAESLADEERGHVELVVVKEDGGRVVALGGLHHGGGEAAVDGDVALIPGTPRIVSEVRRVREVVEAVLDEPEQGVGELVVHQVVGLGVVFDEPDAQVFHLEGRLLF